MKTVAQPPQACPPGHLGRDLRGTAIPTPYPGPLELSHQRPAKLHSPKPRLACYLLTPRSLLSAWPPELQACLWARLSPQPHHALEALKCTQARPPRVLHASAPSSPSRANTGPVTPEEVGGFTHPFLPTQHRRQFCPAFYPEVISSVHHCPHPGTPSPPPGSAPACSPSSALTP